MGIRGIIFDFNGTLVQDTHLHNLAWLEFFRRHGLPLMHENDMFHLHGKTNRDILNLVFGRVVSDQDVERFSFEKEELYRGLCAQTKLQLMEGAEALFALLLEKKVPFTIATASDKANVDFYFRYFPLATYFDQNKVVFNDGHIPGKPHPMLFELAMQQLGLQPHEVLIFEDSFNGIRAAENANAGSIVIVDSHGEDYAAWNYPVITNFNSCDASWLESLG